VYNTRHPRESCASMMKVYKYYAHGLYYKYNAMDFWYNHLALPYNDKE
jgi:hypothetical protein